MLVQKTFYFRKTKAEVMFGSLLAEIAILNVKFGGQILRHCTDNLGWWIILIVDINHTLFIFVNTKQQNK